MHRKPKDLYLDFCNKTCVPIYSQPWWLDAICGKDNWDVWLYEQGGVVVAAMPYYLEERDAGLYITKAPLTQNNGILFKYPDGAQYIARSKFEAKVISSAVEHIRSLDLAVYEQQYQCSFLNWLPFYWEGFEAIPRYTYIIEDTSDVDRMWEHVSSSYRKNIKKGIRNGEIREGLDPETFYQLHAKVFERQSLPVPFSEELWMRLYSATAERDACKLLYSETNEGVASVLFLVWDQRSVYHLMGGTMPGFNGLETYNALTWRGMNIAHEKRLMYDFEGSMIERISKSFREFGGIPKLYFRIRKVFDPRVILAEAQQKIDRLEDE